MLQFRFHLVFTFQNLSRCALNIMTHFGNMLCASANHCNLLFQPWQDQPELQPRAFWFTCWLLLVVNHHNQLDIEQCYSSRSKLVPTSPLISPSLAIMCLGQIWIFIWATARFWFWRRRDLVRDICYLIWHFASKLLFLVDYQMLILLVPKLHIGLASNG